MWTNLRSSRKRDATLSIIPFFVSLQQLLRTAVLRYVGNVMPLTKHHSFLVCLQQLHHDTNSTRTNHFRKQLVRGGGTNLLLCR
jgi:hypothetical protein